jgi:hypothetical protein
LPNCKRGDTGREKGTFLHVFHFFVDQPLSPRLNADSVNVEEEERAMKIGSMLVLALFTCAAAPAAAQPSAQEDQNSCMNDAMTVWSQFIPDRERVAGCLISNRGRISQPCRAQLTHWRN